MQDDTENVRRAMTAEINGQVQTQDKDAERSRLESQYGKVWSTAELTAEFEVLGFMAPFVVVKRRADGQKGSLEFQHSPRFYFNFRND